VGRRTLSDLTQFLCGLPILALACVIDRRGYDHRYRPKYQYREMWHMCRTAFSIAVEHACKYAISEGRKLRVYPESGDPACTTSRWQLGCERRVRLT